MGDQSSQVNHHQDDRSAMHCAIAILWFSQPAERIKLPLALIGLWCAIRYRKWPRNASKKGHTKLRPNLEFPRVSREGWFNRENRQTHMKQLTEHHRACPARASLRRTAYGVEHEIENQEGGNTHLALICVGQELLACRGHTGHTVRWLISLFCCFHCSGFWWCRNDAVLKSGLPERCRNSTWPPILLWSQPREGTNKLQTDAPNNASCEKWGYCGRCSAGDIFIAERQLKCPRYVHLPNTHEKGCTVLRFPFFPPVETGSKR